MLDYATATRSHPHTKVAIIGASCGGIAMAIRLQQHGIYDFIILEKGNDFGGTWRDNQYPGAACDVQSHLYSLSFAPKSNWSKRYAEAPEIFSYIQDLVTDYNLRAFCRLNTEVLAAHYQAERCLWQLQLQDQSILEAQFVIFASGPLHIPQIPDILGIEKFQGRVFHSAQWDHTYDPTGKNVASIGTGGSAIQYIPEIAPQCKHLYVMQRTAAWVIPRDERAYPDLEKKLFKKYDWFRKLHRARLYWSNESRVVPIAKPGIMKFTQKLAELFIKYEVKNPELAEKLTPRLHHGL
ncbi:cyclohexanone monooxygenase [Acinetobacter lwoffii]|uniref:Cyclohexanone monooxygenase n=1 Tax=Acinetobacter lwoffii TaxID=28090 RepID=A0AAW8LG91_ACILW|nr:cyclohexanone monooxygenase [Acinetobacter lwoffii]